MEDRHHELRGDFVEALREISALMSTAFEQAGIIPEEHALAQAGLSNGHEIVLDYLDHNEAGVAFEHLIYMVNEPPLAISEGCTKVLARIAETLRIPFRQAPLPRQ
ncbi:hypothetical protein [Pseudomonas sp. RIT-PI-S]|uniref:hypothetical protein n=1 Tax=Pseudomonas sp. RIT-PI-S TaxID=3035295 RepID=UPI0021D828BB|nr:hypothetical protein [Pseudomonas sp. RIT-PI-S]